MTGTLASRYAAAETFEHLLQTTRDTPEFWSQLHERARVAPAVVDRVRVLPGRWHLLILSENWCGDSVNIIPLIARLTEAAPNVDLRVLRRDENLDLMDAHLTGTSRSIPVVMLLDEEYRERGWWGPRPAPLQRWFIEHGLTLPKNERYREARAWYARDHGATTMEEIAAMMEHAAATGRREPVVETVG